MQSELETDIKNRNYGDVKIKTVKAGFTPSCRVLNLGFYTEISQVYEYVSE